MSQHVPDNPQSWFRLANSKVPRATLSGLLEVLGNAGQVLQASAGGLKSAGANDEVVARLQSARDADVSAEMAWLKHPQCHLLVHGTESYPRLLDTLQDAPLLLYVAGDPDCLSLPQLAMVGSRNPTPPGEETAYQFAAHLATGGLTITSGLALGIDSASHRGALSAGGTTVAVLGSGIDTIYPSENRPLATEILASGALVSELPLGSAPLKSHFPARNRLISGLSMGTLVVEAAVRSGSLITARLAGEQGREVFAIPGSIHNPMARGCHRLLREGAKLVESADDILEELAPLCATLLPAGDDLTPEDTAAQHLEDPDYAIVLQAMGYEAAAVDQIMQRTGLTADVVSSMLLILELQGDVRTAPGGKYVRLPNRDTRQA